MKEEISKKKEAFEELRKTRNDMDAKCKRYESDISDLNKEVSRWKAKLEVSSKNDEMLKQYRESSNTLKSERDSLRQELDTVKQQLQELKADTRFKEATSAKVRDLTKAVKEKDAQLAVLQKEVAGLSGSKKKLKEETDRLQKLLEEYKGKVKVLDGKLEEEREKMQGELKNTKKTATVKGKELDNLEKAYRSEVSLLNGQVEIFMMVLKNLFKENLREASIPEADIHQNISKQGASKYMEGLAILDLGSDQLNEFIAPHAQRKFTDFKNHMEEELEKFEKMLSMGENLNGSTIQKTISEVIDDRVAKAAKKAGN